MTKENRIVWSDQEGDLRKKPQTSSNVAVKEENLELKIRKLTAGKGRTVIEIKGLPKNDEWNKDFAKLLKQSLGVGGSYKMDYIEVHTDKIENVIKIIESKKIKWKKTGG